MKVSKENFGWIFSCILLSLALITSVILGFGGFYYQNTNSFVCDLKVGDSLQLEMRGNEANSMSLNIDGSYLPNQKIKQDLFVKNLELDEDIYLRAKAYIFSSQGRIINVNVDLGVNWKYNLQDGYYYYNAPLSPQNKSIFASSILLDENNTLVSSKKYIFTMLCESLTSLSDVQKLWKVDYSTFFNLV